MEVSFMADNGNLDRIAQEQSSPKSKDRLSAQIIDLRVLAMQNKRNRGKQQSVNKPKNKLVGPQRNGQTSSKLLNSNKFQQSVKRQLQSQRSSFAINQEATPEVALKNYMSGVRNSENKKIPPFRHRSQSAKKDKGSSLLNSSLQKKNRLQFDQLSQSKFECYLREAKRTTPKRKKQNSLMSPSFYSSNTNFSKHQPNKSNKFCPRSYSQKKDPRDQIPNRSVSRKMSKGQMDSSTTDQNLLQSFKNYINLLKATKQQHLVSTSVKQQPLDKSHPANRTDFSKNNTYVTNKKPIHATTPGLAAQIRSMQDAAGMTQSTDLTDNKTGLVMSLDPRKVLSNQLNSNTYNSNTMYSLQQAQHQCNSINNKAKGVSESFNKADISSFNHEQYFSPQIEDIHYNIVQQIQLQKRLLADKEGQCLNNDSEEDDSFQEESFSRKRSKSKSRCSGRKLSSNVVFVKEQEV